MQRTTLTESERQFIVAALDTLAGLATSSADTEPVQSGGMSAALKRATATYEALAKRIEDADDVVLEVK